MEPVLKLDRLAQLRAELEAGVDEAALLDREQLSADAWRDACTHWDKKLAEEAELRRSVLSNRYNTALNVKRRLLASKRRPAEPEPAVEQPTPAPAAPPSPPPAPPAPPVAAAPAPIPAAPLPPPTTGFAQPSFGETPPPVMARAPEPARGDFSGTVISDLPGGQSLADAMPFLRDAARAAGIQLPPRHSGPSSGGAAGALPAVDGGATVTLENPAGAAGKALPFLEAARAARAGAKPPEAAPLPPPLPDYSGTLTLDPSSAEGAAALPFMGALREQRLAAERARGPARRFSLEQFAALTAQIAAAPEAITEVRRRWGLTEASHRSESEAWQLACAADPSLFERYTALVKQLRSKVGR